MSARVIIGAMLVAAAAAQIQRTTPVPILRQINTHNDDGSYTYGFEAADGSYKIETKAATGEVRGKYGYVDTEGKLREIEYGANRNGFNPAGTGIQVPPPVVAPAIASNNDYEDDGQYRPELYEAPYQNQPQQQQQSQISAPSRLNLARNFNYNPAPVQQQQQQPQQQYYQPQPQYQQQAQPAYQPVQVPHHIFNGHPARNIDLNSGSYSIQY